MIPRNINLKTGGRDQESPNSAFVASRLPAKNQPSFWLRSGPLAGDQNPTHQTWAYAQPSDSLKIASTVPNLP